jgi:uncharacterized DUF497 family protein
MGAHIDEMAHQNIETVAVSTVKRVKVIFRDKTHSLKHSPIMMAITMIPMTPMMIIIYEERGRNIVAVIEFEMRSTPASLGGCC